MFEDAKRQKRRRDNLKFIFPPRTLGTETRNSHSFSYLESQIRDTVEGPTRLVPLDISQSVNFRLREGETETRHDHINSTSARAGCL